MESRLITVFSSRGGIIRIETNVATWGELKPLLREQGQDVENLLGTINTTKKDLEKNEDILPETPFTIFFRPKETKAGSARKEIFKKISKIIEKEGEEAKKFFCKDKHYTNKSTDVLEKLVSEFENKSAETTTEKVVAEELEVTAEEVVMPTNEEVQNPDEEQEENLKEEQNPEDLVIMHLTSALDILKNKEKKEDCKCEEKIENALEEYKKNFEGVVRKSLIDEEAALRKEAVSLGLKL